jgi:hypothetical protein
MGILNSKPEVSETDGDDIAENESADNYTRAAKFVYRVYVRLLSHFSHVGDNGISLATTSTSFSILTNALGARFVPNKLVVVRGVGAERAGVLGGLSVHWILLI